MNTPTPAPRTRPPRQHLHRRLIDCNGYKREDGLFDLEVTLNDTKSYSFPNEYRHTIAAGEPIHGMLLRVAVDIHLVIHEVEVRMAHTPYRDCANIETKYQQAIGLQIKPGFTRKIRELFPTELRCAHINEMWGILGTLAFQTTFPERYRESASNTTQSLVGMCHMHATPEKVEQNTRVHEQD